MSDGPLPLGALCARSSGPSVTRCTLMWPSPFAPLAIELDTTAGTWRRTLAAAWLVPPASPGLSLRGLLERLEMELTTPPSTRASCSRESVREGLGWNGTDARVLDVIWEWDVAAAWRGVQWPPLEAYFADRLANLESQAGFARARAHDVLAIDPSVALERLIETGRAVRLMPEVWLLRRVVTADFAAWAAEALRGVHAVDALGLQPMLAELVTALGPLLRSAVPDVGPLTHSFAFARRYDAADAPRARHDAHHDDAHATVNIALTHSSSFVGSGLAFCGRFGEADYRQLRGVVRWDGVEVGDALVHPGTLRHRALEISGGARQNLVLWAMSASTRQAVSPGPWEDALPPSRECVSVAADRDACAHAAADDARDCAASDAGSWRAPAPVSAPVRAYPEDIALPPGTPRPPVMREARREQ